jgi:Protein of unknown function (DUF3313)
MSCAAARFSWQGLAALAGALALSACAAGCGLIETELGAPLPGQLVPMTHAPGEYVAPPAPAPAAKFFSEPQLLAHHPGFPFAQMWIKPGADLAKYTQLMVAPVSLAYLQPLAPHQGQPVTQKDQSDAALDLAVHANDSIAQAVARDVTHRLTVADSAGPNVLELQLAIVELEPNLATRAAAAGAQPAVATHVQTPAQTAGQGNIAIEAKLADSVTHETVAMIYDRRIASLATAGPANPSMWAFAQPTMDEWGQQIVALVDAAAAANR